MTRSNIPATTWRDAAVRALIDADEGVDCGDSGIPARPAPDCNFSSEDSRECATARKAEGVRFTGLIVSSHPSPPLPLPLLSSWLFGDCALRGENFKGSCKWSGSVCDGTRYRDGVVSSGGENDIRWKGLWGREISPLL